MSGWIDEQLVQPASVLIACAPLGGEVGALDRLHERGGLCLGIEGVFRRFVRSEYRSWPPESTTDGLIADLCVRTGPTTLEFVGMCFVDFAGERFPLRVEIELSDDGAALGSSQSSGRWRSRSPARRSSRPDDHPADRGWFVEARR